MRTYKDTVFRMLFRDIERLLIVFNAVNGTHYENPEELQINVLKNAIYMNMKDVSCVMDARLNLYEHQSIVNPNMTLCDLFYVSRIYEAIYKEEFYGSQGMKLSASHFIVSYNGEDKQPEQKVIRLFTLYRQSHTSNSAYISYNLSRRRTRTIRDMGFADRQPRGLFYKIDRS